MPKTKRYFAQMVLDQIKRDLHNIDFKIDERDVFARLDQVVNEMARRSFFENWKFSGGMVDEQYITTWDGDNAIDVQEDDNDAFSYIILPSEYVDLPRSGGIAEIYSTDPNFQSVIIMQHHEYRMMLNNKSGNLQGRLGGYAQGQKFKFTESDVANSYSEKFCVRLVNRGAASIDIDAAYPIPSDRENYIITSLVDWFKGKIAMGQDRTRDNNLTPTP